MKKKRIKTEAAHEELLRCMDYLHGDVVDSEFRAACEYEYARESKVLQKAAQLLRSNPAADAAEIAFQIERESRCVKKRSEELLPWMHPQITSRINWFIQAEWFFIWECPSFPAKSWNQLGEKERADLLR